ncbi:MAG: oligopeptide transporter, OPT family [Pseudomonadota bacterium]
MSSQGIPPQLTLKAIVLGVLLSMVLAGANAYLGLFAGLTVSASIPAAVISMALLRMFKNSNILENNIVQTSASAGESVAAGVIFTIPALIILDYWQVFQYWWVTVIAGLGGLLGVLFTVPLRRALIVEENLAYPEGKATAEVLRVGDDPAAGMRYLVFAALAGGLTKLAETGLRLWSGSAAMAGYAGKSTIAYIGTNLSPALLSVGYIVGLNIAVLVFAGGAISWYLAIPIYSTFFLDGDPAIAAMVADGAPAVDVAFRIWTSKIRYLGVGAMLIGGIWALISMRGSLLSGVRSGLSASKGGAGGAAVDHTQRDTPMQVVLVLIAAFIVPIAILYFFITGDVVISGAMTVIMIVAGFLFSSVAAYMAGLVGSSNNPISGITIATILFSSLLLAAMMGANGAVGPAAAIMVGAVVCSAAAIAGDNLQDLKAGYIVGATPWRQQLMQGVGVVSAVLVMAPILNLLLKAYGIGEPTPDQPDALLAPQATLMASVAQGVFGGGLPWGMVAIGAAIGAAIIALDLQLQARGSAWRAPVLAVAVGIYLPLELSVPIFIGGIVAELAKRYNERVSADPAEAERRQRFGMLFAAGLITGEALVGIFMAIPIVLTSNPNVIALPFSLPGALGSVPGLLVMAALTFTLLRLSQVRS